MRSLIDIVDLTVEEIDDLIATANDIIASPDNMQKSATAKNWRRSFLSLPPVHV